MYFVIAGAGQVGFHLAQALIEAGHEVMIIEEEKRRAQWIQKPLGIEETVSSTRVLMGVIEQELPMRGLVPIMPLVTAGLEIVEAEIAADSPSAGKPIRELRLPDGATVGCIVRKRALVRARADERLQPGDRIIAFTPTTAET